MDNANGTWLLTASLIGMTIGALTMGWLTDKLGRRKLLIGAVPLTASGAAPSSCGPCRPRGPGPGAGRGP